MNKRLVSYTTPIILLLSACTSTPALPPSPVTSAELDLLDVATSVEHSLRVLAASKKQRMDLAINTKPLTTAEGGMGEKASIDWAGPIEPLLQKIADMSHYKLKVLGPNPAIPIIVAITANDVVMADILKDAGLQAAEKANVVVFPKEKTIELRYARV